MASMLSTLLSARSRQSRDEARAKAARDRARRNRPAVEALDPRCLLAVSASFNPVSGVLNIVTDRDYNTQADVSVTPDGRISVWNDYKANQADLAKVNPLAAQVKKIVVVSNVDPSKWFQMGNHTNIDTDYYTNSSNGLFYGGGGTNRFYAGSGIATSMGGPKMNYFFDSATSRNDYMAGAGDNVLYRATDHTYLQARPGVTPRTMLTVGIRDDAYANPALLNTAGINNTLTAYLDTSRTVLTLSGPTGAGMRIYGNWSDTYSNSVHTFGATGTLSIETGLKNPDGSKVRLPINTLGQTFRITTKPTAVADSVGEFGGMTWAGAMPLNSSGGGAGALGDLSSKYGLNFNLPGVSWGLKMGADLAKTTGMPLLANVPYLYASASTGASLSFGSNISLSTAGAGFTVALNPADPSFFAQFATPMGTFSAGGSLQGAIPYTPLATPDAVGDPNIWGNLYTSAGSIALGSLPATISGSSVIDFDANNDGKVAGIDRNTIADLLAGKTRLDQVAGDVANDLAFGFNGGLALSTTKYGINLSATTAVGSAFYSPNLLGGNGVAFRVSSVNPFAGTALEPFTPKSKVDVGGYFSRSRSTGQLNWGFSASTASVAIGGIAGASATFDASSATNTVAVGVNVSGLLGAAAFRLDGSVNLGTGDFELVQTLVVGMDLGIAQVNVNQMFRFARRNGVTSFTASLSAYVRLGDSTTNIYGGFSALVYLGVDDGGRVSYSGSGTAYVGITLAGDPNQVSVGIGFDNSGFSVSILDQTLKLSW